MANNQQDVIETPAFSFCAGNNRHPENRLWNGWFAKTVGKTIRVKPSSGGERVDASYDSMVLQGLVENVVASAIAFRGVEQIVRPLAFGLRAPKNLMRNVADVSVNGASGFYAYACANWYGASAIKEVQAASGLWVIVDPHLLSDEALNQMQTQLKNKPVLLIMPVGVKVPAQLRKLAIAGKNEAFPTNSLAPYMNETLEEAMMGMGANRFNIAGAGPRLLPTIIGVVDTVLQHIEFPLGKKVTNQLRREIVEQHVSYALVGPGLVPWCEFDTTWAKGSMSLFDAAVVYLETMGFITEEVYPDELNTFEGRSEFAITPFWQPA